MIIDKNTLSSLLEKAATSPRLRMNLDLRTTPEDKSQRILNALLPGTPMPIHRHMKSTETIVLLRGRMEEIFYEDDPGSERGVKEVSRYLLEACGDVQGLSIPVGQWHGINVLEPTVILECKDGAYEPLSAEDQIL